jgi:protein-tyrosine phosphatase
MIDLHCHILPGIDDGPETMTEALMMCHIAIEDGIHTIVATPHCCNGQYHNDEHSIQPVYEDLKRCIQQNGMSLDLRMAGDIHIHPDLLLFLKENSCLTLGGRYVLVEFSSEVVPRFLKEFLLHLRLGGYTPILTHPERNRTIQKQPSLIKGWVQDGGVTQITAMSLTGHFGSKARRTAFYLLDRGWVHCVATDAHSATWRKPILSEAVTLLKNLVGDDGVQNLVKKNPWRILTGEDTVSVFPLTWNGNNSWGKSFFRKYSRLPQFFRFWCS